MNCLVTTVAGANSGGTVTVLIGTTTRKMRKKDNLSEGKIVHFCGIKTYGGNLECWSYWTFGRHFEGQIFNLFSWERGLHLEQRYSKIRVPFRLPNKFLFTVSFQYLHFEND